jgi:hypothetical protein
MAQADNSSQESAEFADAPNISGVAIYRVQVYR